VILGDDEVAARNVTLKPLRGDAEQRMLGVDAAIDQMR
jgi:hypothetical protein